MGKPGPKPFTAIKHIGFGRYWKVDADGNKVGNMMYQQEAEQLAQRTGKPLLTMKDKPVQPRPALMQQQQHALAVDDEIGKLRREVRALEQRLQASQEIVADLGKQRDEARADAKVHQETEARWYKRWQDADAERKTLAQKVFDVQVKLEAAEAQLRANGDVRATIEREREEARIYAEQLRQQLYPQAPAFPWEGTIISGEKRTVGDVSWETWRGPKLG